jgi:hypothetical protein
MNLFEIISVYVMLISYIGTPAFGRLSANSPGLFEEIVTRHETRISEAGARKYPCQHF